jgi:anaerobic magnesium-protoporphyrin IX monomethyl ester cyclase
MSKKYLHICPPWYVFHGSGNLRQPNVPLGAAYCARAALSVGWQAQIWNGDLLPEGGENQYSEEMTAYSGYLVNQSRIDNPVWDELRATLLTLRPDVVGITALTASYPSALRCAAIVKDELPACLVVLGGPHPNALPEQCLKDSFDIDIVVTGEGEITLGEILTRVANREPIWNISGTVSGRVLFGEVNPPRSFVPDLDTLGWPVKGRVYDPHTLLNRDHFGLVMNSRGCPYYCEFCASPELWTRKVRWRSPKDMAAEMLAIHKEYDTRYFSFEDDTFTLNRPRTIELMKAIIDTGLTTVPGFRWTCNTRPDAVDEERLNWLKRAGCAAVAVGIESGNPRILKKTQKAFTADEVRAAVKLIKQAELVSSGQFMIGLPTETEAEMMDTVNLAGELECESVMLSVATPLPATLLYQEALTLGLIPPEGIDWATVTTKNDGMLMTIEHRGKHIPMPLDQRRELVAKIQGAFDEIQNRTLEVKNSTRHYYEAQYLPENELAPVYGFRKVGGVAV